MDKKCVDCESRAQVICQKDGKPRCHNHAWMKLKSGNYDKLDKNRGI